MPDADATPTLVHGTCLDIGKTGVLILGPPGSGKSDLALRLIDAPGHGLGADLARARLVADDQVLLLRDGGGVVASAPAPLAGLIEVRGIGILRADYRPRSRLGLIVRLVPVADIERLPEPSDLREELLGTGLPSIRIDPRLASAPARLRAALQALSGPAFPARLTISTEELRSPVPAD
jgi:serine kinase of HPr protein (carbohydrate metabolism regulator)